MVNKRDTIVVIDDDEDILRLITASFKELGYKIHTEMDGKGALSFLSTSENRDSTLLIVLDRILPDMDGLDILKMLNQYEKKVPVLVLSVLAEESDVIFALSEGAVDYVTKPFSLPVLIEKALSLINHK